MGGLNVVDWIVAPPSSWSGSGSSKAVSSCSEGVGVGSGKDVGVGLDVGPGIGVDIGSSFAFSPLASGRGMVKSPSLPGHNISGPDIVSLSFPMLTGEREYAIGVEKRGKSITTSSTKQAKRNLERHTFTGNSFLATATPFTPRDDREVISLHHLSTASERARISAG